MAQRKRTKIQKSLVNKGFLAIAGKKHDLYVLIYDGKKTAISTLISRGSGYKEYSQSLLSSMSQQLKINNQELLSLIDCAMSYNDYIKVLLDKNIIL